jgi:hypothetical protein
LRFSGLLRISDLTANLMQMSIFFSSNINWDETEFFSSLDSQQQQSLKSLNIVIAYTREEEYW